MLESGGEGGVTGIQEGAGALSSPSPGVLQHAKGQRAFWAGQQHLLGPGGGGHLREQQGQPRAWGGLSPETRLTFRAKEAEIYLLDFCESLKVCR